MDLCISFGIVTNIEHVLFCYQSLAFRKGTLQLYTGSFDRTVKLFDLSVLGYVETLFGHQDTIVSIDALRGETAITAGARDRTLRYWKIPEESQLVFRGGGKSALRELLEGGAFEGHESDEEGNRKKGKGIEKQKTFVEGTIECVAMIDETNFVSGGNTGYVFRSLDILTRGQMANNSVTVQYVSGTLKKRNRHSHRHCVMVCTRSSRPPKALSRHHDG